MKVIRRRPGILGACVLMLLSINLGGCGRAPERATIQAETRHGNDNLAPVNNPIPVLYDGFEGKTLADFWMPGNYGSGRYVPGAIILSTNCARSGTHSAEITVHEGDIDASGDDNTRVERAELDSGHRFDYRRLAPVWPVCGWLCVPGVSRVA